MKKDHVYTLFMLMWGTKTLDIIDKIREKKTFQPKFV